MKPGRPAAAAVLLAGFAQGAGAETFDCIMDPSMTVELANASGGIVEEIAIRRGASVAAGQIVARLASSVEHATVRALEIRASDLSAIEAEQARLGFLERRLERGTQLKKRGVATQEALDEIQADVDATRSRLARAQMERATAEQELERARAVLARTVIRSPIDGLIAERALDEGEYLHPESHVATIVRLDPLRVEAFVPVAFYGRIAVGDIVLVRPAPPINGEYEAEVAVIDQVFDAASGTFLVELDMPNPQGKLPAGHRCTVAFNAPGH